jgi:hypothetical protein
MGDTHEMKSPLEAGDPISLVKITEALSKDPAITREEGAFARGDWDHRDRTTITHAKVNTGWWAKSAAQQRKEIEKICGTYAVGSSPSSTVKEMRNVRLAQPWTLKDNKADAPANAILIKAADKVETKSEPSAPLAPPPRAASPRRCCEECGTELDYRARSDAKFCCEKHSKAFRRREAKREIANKAFKDWEQSAHAKAEAAAMLKVYRFAGDEMRSSAARCSIEATFVATTGNIVAIHDKPLPPLRAMLYAHQDTGGEWLRLVSQTVKATMTKGNLTTDHPDVIALMESVGAATDGPERSVTLYQFEMPTSDHVGLSRFELRFRGDPGTGWCDSYDPLEDATPQHPRDIALMELYDEARAREIRAALKARRSAHVRDN